MKPLRLSFPGPCVWGLAVALSPLLAGSSSATVLSLPGMGWQLPEGEGGNAALGAGGAGKEGLSSLANLARNREAENLSSLASLARNREAGRTKTETAPQPKPETPEQKKTTSEAPPAEPAAKRQGTKGQKRSAQNQEAGAPVERRTTAPAPSMDKGPDTSVAPPVENRPTLYVTAGYSNRLYFRGLDILDRVSPDDATGAMTTRVKVSKGGWEFGAQYLQALDPQLPDRDALKSEPNLVDPITGLTNPAASNYENFRVPSKDRYTELDLWMSYTRPLGAGWTGTLGATYYYFGNKQFWGLDHAFEMQAGLSYTRLPYVVPSLLYAYDFDGF